MSETTKSDDYGPWWWKFILFPLFLLAVLYCAVSVGLFYFFRFALPIWEWIFWGGVACIIAAILFSPLQSKRKGS